MLTSKPKIPTFYGGRYGFWRLIYILIFALLLSAILLTYYFIYENIYSTVANANAIISLKSDVNLYNLDLGEFEKASAAINKKQQLESFFPDPRNMFYYRTPTSTYVNSSTQS